MPDQSNFIKAPEKWWTYHHKHCGTLLRGCHPTLCPKNVYELTGKWIGKEKLMSTITCTAKWISDENYYIDGDLMATKDDILRIHGKHVSDGEFVVRGDRSNFFFWAKPEYIELLSELPNHLKTNP